MNILQFIKKGKLKNKQLSLLAINFKKAFDSVSHEYILEMLKCFNYSDYMIKIVRTTMKKKIAGIMTESNIITIFGLDISENFDLEETNFNKLMVKIRGMLLFWAKFKLSIVG